MRHLALLALPLLLVACSSSPTPPGSVAGDVSEVTVARCPAEVKLALGKPTVAKTTPTTTFDGNALSATEVDRVAAVMESTRGLAGLDLALTLDRTQSGRCFYKGAEPGQSATFRTKNGNDIFQVFLPSGLQAFVFPDDYGTSGLVFGPNASASLMANVSASGPFSDGASISVRIGSAAIGGPSRGPGPVVLEAGADLELLDGPEKVSFIAKGKDVTGSVTSGFSANCVLEENEAASTDTEKHFDLTVDYHLDDGFNGCTVEFTNAKDFDAVVQVGLFIDD